MALSVVLDYTRTGLIVSITNFVAACCLRPVCDCLRWRWSSCSSLTGHRGCLPVCITSPCLKTLPASCSGALTCYRHPSCAPRSSGLASHPLPTIRSRAVGVLLGQIVKGKVSCTNSYAVPFEEDERDPTVWFLDHNFLESMSSMFRKVNARETVVGWYSTGPTIRGGDLDITELIRTYTPNPVLVLVDVTPKELGLPTEAYLSVEQPQEDATLSRTFAHLPSEINAADAEEVGVGHLLRDIKDSSVSTLAGEVAGKVGALKSLRARLGELKSYLEAVATGELPMNHEILYNMQDIFNLLPALSGKELVRSFAVKTNDAMLVLYVSAVIRAVCALDDLIENKAGLMRETERRAAEKSTPAVVAPVGGKAA